MAPPPIVLVVGGRAGRRRRPGAAGPAAGGQADGRALGISGRQGRPGRDARGGADPRARRGARHRRRRELPRAVHLRLPRLPRLPPADAALCLPQMVGHSDSRARGSGSPGCARPGSATIRCRRPTSRSSRCCATCCKPPTASGGRRSPGSSHRTCSCRRPRREDVGGGELGRLARAFEWCVLTEMLDLVGRHRRRDQRRPNRAGSDAVDADPFSASNCARPAVKLAMAPFVVA